MNDANLFNNRPQVKKKLNVLPENPDQVSPEAVKLGRFPSWLHRKLPKGGNLWETGEILNQNRLHTVCEEAKCPNLLECWSKKTATFLIMGKECTRACGFCDIAHNSAPKSLDEDEPHRLAESVCQLGLRHVVITMVARDDLEDGGASHLVKVVQSLRQKTPGTSIELLTSDFQGNQTAWDQVLNVHPDIFNYNVETVRRLTPHVRHKATYERTLAFLSYAKKFAETQKMGIKSGLMVGLGETKEEVFQTILDLKEAGCDMITIGQYLQASRKNLRVKAFITPDQFKEYEQFGLENGVKKMYCGPFVRSSYNAGLI